MNPLRLVPISLLTIFLLTNCTPSLDRIDDYTEILRQESARDIILYRLEAPSNMPEVHLNLEPYRKREEVLRWIDYFTGKGRKYFARLLKRGERYRRMITYFLAKEELPSELFYMALIESGFVLKARSSMQAVGLWQFMRGTGRRYSLNINAYVDERIDPIRSTIAASRYFHDLHKVFQSWTLAMAAYGAGEMRIVGAIMSRRSRDYWDLCERKALPKETRHYIPKFIAAALIGQNRAAYGFSEFSLPSQRFPPALAYVKVPGPTSLAVIAQATRVDLKTLRQLNPHLRQGVTPPGSYALWFPFKSKPERLQTGLATLRQEAASISQHSSDEQPPPRQFYKVRRGDTLIGIAKKFGMSLRQLKKLNAIRSSRIYPGQRLKVTI